MIDSVVQSPYVFVALGSKKEPFEYSEVFYNTHIFENPKEMEKKILDLKRSVLSSETWHMDQQSQRRLDEITFYHDPLDEVVSLFEALSEAFGKDSRITVKEDDSAYAVLVTNPRTNDKELEHANKKLEEILEQKKYNDWKIIKNLPFHLLKEGYEDSTYFITDREKVHGIKLSDLDERLNDSAFRRPSLVKDIYNQHDDNKVAWAAMSLMVRSGMGRFYQKVGKGDVLEIRDPKKVKTYKNLYEKFEKGILIYDPEKIPERERESLPTILNLLVRDRALEICGKEV